MAAGHSVRSWNQPVPKTEHTEQIEQPEKSQKPFRSFRLFRVFRNLLGFFIRYDPG